jgi:hypothetical protein
MCWLRLELGGVVVQLVEVAWEDLVARMPFLDVDLDLDRSRQRKHVANTLLPRSADALVKKTEGVLFCRSSTCV